MTTTTPFVEGAKVLRVRYGRFGGPAAYSTATIGKVWKNGKFFLEGDHDQKGWTGGFYNGQWRATQRDYNSATLYAADDACVLKQRDEAKASRDASDKITALIERLTERRKYTSMPYSTEQLAALDATLAAFAEAK